MLFSTTISVVVAVLLTCTSAQTTSTPVTGTLGNATLVVNNPPGIMYIATLPDKEFFNPSDPRGNVKGSVSATAGPNGNGVSFSVTFSNLPTSGGPFLYHLHNAPVPADGNCTGTLGHLDPFHRGEKPKCDPSLPQTCQVGDLAGKYGLITSDPFTATYTDDFASTIAGSGSFFGNRSLTLHFGNATRLTCANFTMRATNSTAATSPTLLPFTGGAASSVVAPMLYLLTVGALALVL